MSAKPITDVQRRSIARQLNKLPNDEKAIFRDTLEKEGIDPWQLPIVPFGNVTSDDKNSDHVKKTLPLSFCQQRFWLIEQLEPGNPIYNVFFALNVKGKLDIAALNASLNDIIERHHILRTSYVNENGEGRQWVRPFEPLELEMTDLVGQSVGENSLQSLMLDEAQKPFDLLNDVRMIRSRLIKTSDRTHILLFCFHHIAFDALSAVNFMQFLHQGYLAKSKDKTTMRQPDPHETLQYSDFAQWQTEWSQSNAFNKQVQYWQKQLQDAPTTLALPTQFRRPAQLTYAGDSCAINLPESLSEQVHSLADRTGTTLYMVLLAAFNILLSTYSRQNDICIGTSIANRTSAELDELLGCFFNTLVMRNQLDPEQPFLAFLQEVRRTTTDAYSHQELPFEQVLEEVLDNDRQDNINPLIQTVFVLNNALDQLSLTLGETDVSVYPAPLHYARFDLTLRITEESTFASGQGISGQGGLRCDMEFNTALFSKDMITSMLRHYQTIIDQIVAEPTILLKQISLDITHEVVEPPVPETSEPFKFSRLPVAENSIAAQFEHWVNIQPEKTALVHEQKSITYQHLNAQANQLAQQLITRNIVSGATVGIYLDRSAEFIVSLLAILKVGAAYVPLDSQWPTVRIDNIIKDSKIATVISQKRLQANLPEFNGHWLCTDELHASYSPQNPDEIPDANSNINGIPDNLAYLIYTSGSTGQPKGVKISQSNLLHYLDSLESRHSLAGKSYGLISTIAADLGNTAIFGALCFGGTLHVISDERATDAEKFCDYFRRHTVDVLKIVPGHLQGLLAAMMTSDDTQNHGQPLRDILPRYCLILGGEACSQSLVKNLHRLAPDCRIINHYGPTETTVGVMTYEYQPNASLPATLLKNNLPIGSPLPGNRVYVVDQNGHQCPNYVAGELWISGPGVSPGYLNQKSLTKSQFVSNPFVNSKASDSSLFNRCYRTGDRVRRLQNGHLEFLGRLDQQVKIRGYRVEPAEIEVALAELKCVLQSAVVVSSNTAEQLQIVVWVVLQPGEEPGENCEAVKLHLQRTLPDYMQPQHVLQLDSLPRTRNGKLDHKQLTDPRSLSQADTKAHGLPESGLQNGPDNHSPTNEKERILVDIWCQVLRQEKVGIHDNFFELGGDSILSLQIITRAKKAGLRFTPKQLFDKKTISAVAAIAKDVSVTKPHVATANTTQDFPLTPIQQWFFESDFETANRNHWNQSVMFKLESELHFNCLQIAVTHVVQRHAALRSRFIKLPGNNSDTLHWKQSVRDEIPSDVCQSMVIDGQLNNRDEAINWLETQATKIHKGLNIETGPLLKVVWFDASQCDNVELQSHLLITVHHLVIDGVSWRILLNDLMTIYQKVCRGEITEQTVAESAKVEANHSYQAWSQTLSDYARSETVLSQAQYWCQTQRTSPFPVQKLEGGNTFGSMQTVKRSLSPHLTQALLQQVPATYRTQINDILVAALVKVLSVSGQTRTVHVELEGHGREEIDDKLDLSQTVGWFTSRYPLYFEIDDCLEITDSEHKENDPASLIKHIKEQLRQVPQHGLGFGVLRYLCNTLSPMQLQQLKERQQAPISFNYLGQFDLLKENNSLLSVANIGVGLERDENSLRPHLIDISAMVSDEQLHLEWHYSENRHEKQWMESLADDYQNVLIGLIEHCLEQPVGGATSSDFPLAKLSQQQLDEMSLPWRNVESIYPLSPMQEGLLFHTLMEPGAGMYFMQYCYEIQGEINLQAFETAWLRVVERHQVLRTAFIRQQEKALQVVYRNIPSPVQILDWRHMSASEQQLQLARWMKAQVEQGFDLEEPCQMAITLIQVAKDRYQMVRSFHHILTDAWCFSLLIMDFLTFYRGITENQPVQLSSPRPYEDYIAWLYQQDMAKAEAFWTQNLAGFSAPTSLAVDRTQSESGVEDGFLRLTPEQTETLQAGSKSVGITLNTLVQGAWGLLLSRYSGDNDIVFGVTVAGRPTDLDGAENTVGLFINTLPLRLNASAELSVDEYLQAILKQNLDMQEYEFAPLVEIQRWSDVPPGEVLFNSLFAYENAPVDPNMIDKLSILEVGDVSYRTHTHYPITVVVLPEETLGLQISYDKALFDPQSIQRMLGHFAQILLSLGDALHKQQAGDAVQVKDIDLLTEQEQSQLLSDWNNTDTDYPRDKCWPELFAQQVERTPDAVVAACQGEMLTYRQLFERSQRIAHGLLDAGVKANDIVAVMDERGLDLMTMIIAVLHTGAAYMPLDPNHPEVRWQHMLRISEPVAVLTGTTSHPESISRLNTVIESMAFNKGYKPKPLSIDGLLRQYSDVSSVTEVHQINHDPGNLAYIIFTSGSTGEPKGAMVEHKGMLNNQYSLLRKLSLTQDDVVAQTASQSFDISMWQFLMAALSGAKVQIYPDDIVRHPSELLRCVERDGVTVLASVPSLTQTFFEFAPPLNHLRWLISTGEALTSELAQRWLQHYPHIPLLNAYGPAECSDNVARWGIHNVADAAVETMPIGQPIDNNRLYVLDDQHRLQPIGVTGEIYVAGVGVGRGYLNEPERTACVFVPDPLHRDIDSNIGNNKARFYRTGDLGRWRDDGVLEYMGRSDHQVKIRGFRIEMGEIEACLESFSQVRRAAVVVKADGRGDDALVAYFEPESSQSNTLEADSLQKDSQQKSAETVVQSLQQKIKRTLPTYMMPALFITLSSMPLNTSGKIDRRALPEPDFTGRSASHSVPVNGARNHTEKALVVLWQQLLNIEEVDIHANFFEFGGHSLIAAQLHARVCQQFDIELPLRTLFEQNSVAEVALQIDKILAAKSLMADADSVHEDTEEFEL